MPDRQQGRLLARRRIPELVRRLAALYPDAAPELEFDSPFELLVAVALSAQCTDVRVNQVTAVLFAAYPDAQALARADLGELEEIVRPCGLYRTKAANIRTAAQRMCEQHGGCVPATRAALEALPGIGRKSANVILSCAMDVPAIAVDTHVYRVSHRIGLSQGRTVRAVEDDLMERVARRHWSALHHQLIFHGRRCCRARSPQCGECGIADLCRNPGRAARANA